MIIDAPVVQESSDKDLTLYEKRKLAERERIETWNNRRAKEQPSFSCTSRSEGNTSYVEPSFDDPTIVQEQKDAVFASSLCAATGTASKDYGRLILSQTYAGLFADRDRASIINGSYQALLAMNPADEYEGMLISRMIVLHNQYMHFMANTASPEQTSQGVDININRATKLMRVYNETLETLMRYRRKGEQKVTVQHVNVTNGGQAIVTGQFNPGGGNDKK